MRYSKMAAVLALAAASTAFAQGKSKKDIPPPIEVTGTDRRTDVFDLPNGDKILQYNTPDRKDQPNAKPNPSRLRIFIPGNHKQIKGTIFDLGYTYTSDSSPLQAVAREEGWAVIGCLLRYKYGTEILNTALKDFAERTGHPELVNCPIIPIGFSRNGSRAWDFFEENPDKTLALGLGGNPGIPSGMLQRDNKTKEERLVPERIALAQAIPALTLVGSKDPFVDYDKGEARFWHNAHYPRIRAQEGVTWGMMIGWGYGHGWDGSWTPFITFFQDAMALRVDGKPAPDGKVTLRKVAFDEGWLCEYGWQTDWPEVAPVKEFKGDKTKAIWVPAANTAHVWRAFQVQKPKVTLTVEGSAGALTLNAAVPNGTTEVEFFDGAKSLGKVTAAPFALPPSPITTGRLSQGTHTVFAVASTAEGKTPSRPITIAGGKALDWKQGEADWKKAEQPVQVARLTPPARRAAEALVAAAAARSAAAKSPPTETAPAALPSAAPADVEALRRELEVLAKDPFVEQRSAAERLRGLLPQ